MASHKTKILQYWRSSLADSVLGKGQFKHRDREKLIRISAEVVRNGFLPDEQVKHIFRDQKDEIQSVSVRMWPFVATRKTAHAADIQDGLPEVVAPVVTEALVSRNGKITPLKNTIARDILSPLAEGVFSIGTVEALDVFLSKSPLVTDAENHIWPQYLDHSRLMMATVTSDWPKNDENYIAGDTGFLEVMDSATATIRQILDLYDFLHKKNPETPLLSQYVVTKEQSATYAHAVSNDFALRLGHSNGDYPLADRQRDVLTHLAQTSSAEVLAVNGPPGTGKTTMLLSAIADKWVKAALNEEMPPIIVAASTNNQAVTNVIDAFGTDFGAGEGPFAGRWLPEIKSFGLYLPSVAREKAASKTYQTEAFCREVESEGYVLHAKDCYLAAAYKAFPDIQSLDVKTVVSAIHKLICDDVDKLIQIDQNLSALEICRSAVAEMLGEHPHEGEAKLQNIFELRALASERLSKVIKIWQLHQANESSFLALFGFLPPIARKRVLRARLTLQDAECDLDLSQCKTIAGIDEKLYAATQEAKLAEEAAKHDLSAAQKLLLKLHLTEEEWQRSVALLGAQPTSFTDVVDLDRFADCQNRFRLFLLATHYWEGRWLMAMEEDLPSIVGSHQKKGRTTVIPRWQRRMMLTPCAVSTFASLPRKMACSRFADGEFETDYLLNFIDLLIVDEAGQVLSEAAGASFALAKQALVIGDTQQIPPISSVPKPVDIGNLLDCGLLEPGFSEETLNALSDQGLRSVDGSVMQMAQSAYGHHPYPELEKGLYLFEHRRCYDDIISYCNTLCYKGTLQPKRGAAPEKTLLPPVGYLHVDGICQSAQGGSRLNKTEAQTIAAWLKENRSRLEKQYDKKLEEIVGVITPFGRQAQELRNACSSNGISISKNGGLTIGTVHSLQGAERKIVIFSPVYSKHADGTFIDRSASMLNVAVSRAKDSFLVFGDMDLFSCATTGSPRAVLAPYLFANEENALQFSPVPRTDLQAEGKQLHALRDAEEHDKFLLRALETAAQRCIIVSPWVIKTTMEQAGVIEAFGKAISRGVEIDVFCDPELTANLGHNGERNLQAVEAALTGIGVRLLKVHQLHSKMVATDSELLCIGSYNWLSAARHGRYARHETSLVYRGTQLEREIETIIDSLTLRELRGARKETPSPSKDSATV
ncbi:AAA domain-containing protein [Pseudovibrio ascidiaceicola]|uniref:AAA domain-containing protein n=1 Tax=Pseudovibrio ascidiaceicola TaxID=285279 RepID=UPI003D36BDEC